MGMIGKWIAEQDDEVLGHVERAKGGWCVGAFVNAQGKRCLIGHALQAGQRGDTAHLLLVAARFDNLARRFGDARIGRAISERARRILRGRRKVPVRVSVWQEGSRTIATVPQTYPVAPLDLSTPSAPAPVTNREPFREEATVG